MVRIGRIIYKYIQLLLTVGFVFCLCFYLLSYYKADFKDLSSNQFLIGYLGVLLGFALTFFTFIISMVEKISEKILKDDAISNNDKIKKQEKLLSILSEVKDNIAFVFFCLLICCTFPIFENIDLPLISLNNYKEFITKVLIINSLKLTIFSLSLYAIYDLTSIIIPTENQ